MARLSGDCKGVIACNSKCVLAKCRKGQCSMFGANASATPDGKLLQLRALDWNVDGKNYSCNACTTVKPPIKDTPKEDKPPYKGQAESTLVIMLYRKSPL